MKENRMNELVTLLTKAMREKNQIEINKYAYQLTVYIYGMNQNYSFEEILAGFGYREIPDEKQISIEEYMRGRKNND